MDDLVSGISFLWSVSSNNGKLLANSDLLRGNIIRPMASDLAHSWNNICCAVLDGVDAVIYRDLEYGAARQYSSLNALTIIWAWLFLSYQWESPQQLTALQKDAYRKKIDRTLSGLLDRWLFASHWAGRWAGSSNTAMTGYARDLNSTLNKLQQESSYEKAVPILKDRFENLVSDLIPDASNHVQTLTTPARERVSVYRNLLWVWHRLDTQRWEMSQIQLRERKRKHPTVEVDHCVSFALWQKKVQSTAPAIPASDDAAEVINSLGNCSLLEKTFNISKSDQSFKSFLDQVFEFKENKHLIEEWAKALALTPALIDPNQIDSKTLAQEIASRDKAIRDELIAFVRGNKARVDITDDSNRSNKHPES